MAVFFRFLPLAEELHIGAILITKFALEALILEVIEEEVEEEEEVNLSIACTDPHAPSPSIFPICHGLLDDPIQQPTGLLFEIFDLVIFFGVLCPDKLRLLQK